MRWIRSFLTYLVLIAATGVTVAAAVVSARNGLPRRELTDYSEIVRWLATSDAAEVSDETQRRLIAKIEESVHSGFDWESRLNALPADERKRSLNNLFELMRIWFLEKVTTFHELPPSRREEYVLREVRQMQRWPALQIALNEETAEEDGPKRSRNGRRQRGVNLTAFAARAMKWRADEPPESQERIDEFLIAAREAFMNSLNSTPK